MPKSSPAYPLHTLISVWSLSVYKTPASSCFPYTKTQLLDFFKLQGTGMMLHCWLILELNCTMTERQQIVIAVGVREQLDVCISEEETSLVPMTNAWNQAI